MLASLFRRRWRVFVVSVACLAAVSVALQIWSARSQAAVLTSDPESILSQPALRRTALAHGAPVYQRYCASCHGANGRGDHALGVPDLTNGVHLYGLGRVSEIEEIARHGIRSDDKQGFDLASMPAYASPRPYKAEPLPALTPGQIEDLTQYVLAFTGRATDPAAALRGGGLYRNYAGCWDCHGDNAQGDDAIGAPSLVDQVWLYGDGSHDDIRRSLERGRAGMSPAFARALNAAQLRDVAVYVASLQPAAGGAARPR